MPNVLSAKVAIVAAIEREVGLLINDWHVRERQYAGRSFRFFENRDAMLVCGGIGAEAARRATEAAIALYQPSLACSVGFAGALDTDLKTGNLVIPRRVVDANDGSSIDTGIGEGVLVSFNSVASVEQKARLCESFSAQAVDMEAAAVAKAAETRGVRFAAIKAISDEHDFELPSMDQFTDTHGEFNTVKFILFASIRPWLWKTVLQLARNSRRASHALCDQLRNMTSENSLQAFGNINSVEALNPK